MYNFVYMNEVRMKQTIFCFTSKRQKWRRSLLDQGLTDIAYLLMQTLYKWGTMGALKMSILIMY